jgi:hypothetical protein
MEGEALSICEFALKNALMNKSALAGFAERKAADP